ncbi:hypothetical protein K7X08_006149 [Anisodus acutangulus]|uniref:Uncharacterized protein n=1 Tax=Anisodus acutangulus TaxID=402998 RepID=A0A9Q1LVY2_9SOLA|nr:hypothetical protein K7X08_006149 [Anisodus acutangulus]
MSTFDTDIEANASVDNANLGRRQRLRRRRPSMVWSSETTTDGSFRFSDSDSDQSWHSPLGSVAGGSYRYEECGSSMRRTEGNLIDLESGELELKVHSKEEKSCRICHLSLLKCGGIGDDDQLLEPWICEICGATAVNIIGGQVSEASNATVTIMGAPSGPVVLSESRRFWHGRRIMNFLLACMIFAFVISWLFHFKIFP